MIFASKNAAIKNFFFWNVGPIKITKKGNSIAKSFLDHICSHQKFPFLGYKYYQISFFGNFDELCN